MRLPLMFAIAVTCFSTAALAQSPQAGNEASGHANEILQNLADKCSDTDAAGLRTRILSALEGLDNQAAIEDLTNRTNQALSLCGEGKVDEAKAALAETLTAAETKVAEKTAQDAPAEVKPSDGAVATEPNKGSEHGNKEAEKGAKPWWQFW